MSPDPFDPNTLGLDQPLRIYLDGETFCLVDPDDYDWLTKWKWKVNWHGKLNDRRYASRRRRVNGGQARVYMHRVITAAPPHLHVDHIDGDGLNNVRANLRLVTPKQNSWNRRPSRGRVGRGL